jgi:hypothetical protein
VSAVVYHRLLKYHHNYRSAIAAITCNYEKAPNEIWTTDFFNWRKGGYVNGGDKNAVPMSIAGPIVQREIRKISAQNYRGHYSYHTPAPDIRTLIDESHGLGTKLQEALSKVSRTLDLGQLEDNMLFAG